MVIVKTASCPGCQRGIKVSVKQLPKGMYEVLFYDGRTKNTRVLITECPYCKTNLFQTNIVKSLTGLETAKINR